MKPVVIAGIVLISIVMVTGAVIVIASSHSVTNSDGNDTAPPQTIVIADVRWTLDAVSIDSVAYVYYYPDLQDYLDAETISSLGLEIRGGDPNFYILPEVTGYRYVAVYMEYKNCKVDGYYQPNNDFKVVDTKGNRYDPILAAPSSILKTDGFYDYTKAAIDETKCIAFFYKIPESSTFKTVVAVNDQLNLQNDSTISIVRQTQAA